MPRSSGDAAPNLRYNPRSSSPSALRLEHGLEAATDAGPLINAAQLERVQSYMGVAQQDVAR